MQHGNDERSAAKHRVAKQPGCGQPCLAKPGLQTCVTRKRHLRILDGEIAQVDRIADGQETDHHDPLDLQCRQAKRMFFHGADLWLAWGAAVLTFASLCGNPFASIGTEAETSNY